MPINPLLRDNGLTTDDEETGNQVVRPTVVALTLEPQGRQETLSPTPQITESVWSAIELTVKDLEPSEQRITNKCGEVDFQLSNH